MTSLAATLDPTGPAPAAAAAPKVDLTDLADPTKVASQSLSFHDVLSAINPLQHIPVVGTIYRAITGDAAPPPAVRVIGGILFGGPVGLITSVANAVLEQSSGKDLGDHALAMLGIGHGSSSDAPQYAANAPAAAPAADVKTGADDSTPTAAASAPAPAAPSAVAATAPAAATIAPVSRAVQGNAPAPLSPLAAMGGRPGLLGSAAAKPASSGYTLADYKAFAGHGMPTTGSTTGPLRNTPVPFQTTVPLSNDVAHMAVTPPVTTPATAVPVPAAEPAPNPADSWISQAMMRGLDRYREMKKLQDQTQRSNGQVDGTF
jgi:hypothetical protein